MRLQAIHYAHLDTGVTRARRRVRAPQTERDTMENGNVPPCLTAGLGMNTCNRERYEWIVLGNGPLHGAFEGWRVSGDEIVSPDGDRMRLRRLRWLMREQWTARKRKRLGGVVVLRPATAGCTRALPSPLPSPPDGRGPVAGAGALRSPALRGGDEAA